jgi:hypothetical protein
MKEDMEEANIGLADIKEMGYEVGEKCFKQIKDKFQNIPDFEAYFAGLKIGFLDNLNDEYQHLEDDEEGYGEDYEEGYYESTQYDKIILESNKWMYGENSSLNEASAKKKDRYLHKGNSSFTIKKIEDTYGTDKLLAQAEFKVYASLFQSTKEHEGAKTSNLSTTLMDKKAFNSDLKDGKFITLKGDPAGDGFKRKVLDKDFSKVLADVKELRADYLKGK